MSNSVRLVLITVIVLVFPSLVFAAKTHKLKKNESLQSLSRKYHVSVEELKAANNLVNARLKKGDVLIIPSRSMTDAASAGTSADTYKARKGETLARIAKKTGITVAELKRLNGLSAKSRVKPGTVLVLREVARDEEQLPKTAPRKVALRYKELFDEKDYEQSLAELVEPEPGQDVDLKKSAELNTDNIRLLKTKAYDFLGTRYRFGGTSRSGIDCSSFVQHVFRDLQVPLPRTAREQFEVGNHVSPGDLQKGDLIFFRTYARFPSHVGIYLGNNKMIHASSRDRRVVVSPMDTPYYRSRFIGAKRIAKINPDVFRWDELLMGVEEESAEDTEANDSLGLTAQN